MKNLVLLLILLSVSLFFIACGNGENAATGSKAQVLKTHTTDGLKIMLMTEDGVLKYGQQNFTLAFVDASGKPMELDAVSVNFHMPAMGTMAVMNDSAKVSSTSEPGVYKGTVDLTMAGEWQVQVAYEGKSGKGKTSFPVSAQ